MNELEDILRQNIAIKGFESINGDGEYFGNLDDASVKVLKQEIQAHTDKAVKEARVEELGMALEAGDGATWDSQMAATCGHIANRIKELQEGKG